METSESRHRGIAASVAIGTVALMSQGCGQALNSPDVDVIVATRGDRQALLKEAVESIVTQQYSGCVRVVIVYDREDPPVNPIESDHDHTRLVSWVHHKGPHGLAQARNVGILQGNAEFVAFLDDDDIWLPGKLSAQVRTLRNNPGTPVVCTDIVVCDESGQRTRRDSGAQRVSHEQLCRSRLMSLHPSTFLIRRTALETIGGVDESLPGAYAEDYDLLLMLTQRGDAQVVRSPLVEIRWTGGSYFFSRWVTIIAALEHLLNKHPGINKDRRGRARVLGQIAFAQAAAAQRCNAVRTSGRCLLANPLQPRLWLALAVASGVTSANVIQRRLHARGRGI